MYLLDIAEAAEEIRDCKGDDMRQLWKLIGRLDATVDAYRAQVRQQGEERK